MEDTGDKAKKSKGAKADKPPTEWDLELEEKKKKWKQMREAKKKRRDMFGRFVFVAVKF